MRIIMFINSYIEGISGGDTWAIEIAKRLSAKEDVELSVVTPERAVKFWKEKGLTQCNYILTTNEKNPGFLPLLYLKRIFNYLRTDFHTNKEDILFATSIFLPDVFPLLFLQGKKVSIFHMQAPHPFQGYKNVFLPGQKVISFGNIINWFNEKVSIFLLKILNTQMLSLPFTKNIVKEFGFQNEKTFVTKNGVDLEYINNISSGVKQFDACWIGRPHPQKGIDDLIEIWKRVSNCYSNARLVLMGANTEIYQDKITSNGLEKNVLIKGYVSEKEKFEIMKKSRFYLSTSYFESFHIAILEALACGMNIFAYDLPVYKQTYGNLLNYIKIGEKKDFADKIINYFKDESIIVCDSKIRNDFVKKYDWNQIADDIYHYIISL